MVYWIEVIKGVIVCVKYDGSDMEIVVNSGEIISFEGKWKWVYGFFIGFIYLLIIIKLRGWDCFWLNICLIEFYYYWIMIWCVYWIELIVNYKDIRVVFIWVLSSYWFCFIVFNCKLFWLLGD